MDRAEPRCCLEPPTSTDFRFGTPLRVLKTNGSLTESPENPTGCATVRFPVRGPVLVQPRFDISCNQKSDDFVLVTQVFRFDC